MIRVIPAFERRVTSCTRLLKEFVPITIILTGETMKDPLRTAAPARTAEPARIKTRTESRIKLALLDAYNTGQEDRGYDPYNGGSGKRSFDAWRSKPKRR